MVINIEYIYHVVTEKPMSLEQKIIFDEQHHNGVYDRVMTYKRIKDGKKDSDDLAEFIKSDMNKWAKIAYRELALEKVRIEKYPNYPSRMACLYTSRTLDEAKNWAEFFQIIGRNVYSIVKLRVKGNIFNGDACNCFDGTDKEEDNIEKANNYWKMDIANDKSIIETLVDGDIIVVEIIFNYKYKI